MNASSATVEGDAHMVAEGAPSPLLLGDLSLVSPSPAAQVVRHASAPYDWDEAYQAQILAHQRKLEVRWEERIRGGGRWGGHGERASPTPQHTYTAHLPPPASRSWLESRAAT